MINLRICWKCKKEYELSSENFYKDSKDKYGFQKRCKECNKIFTKRFAEMNSGYAATAGKKKYAKNVLENPNYNKERYEKYKGKYIYRKSERYKTVRGRLYELLQRAEYRSVKADNGFDLDIEFLLQKYEDQDGRCLLTGIKFELNKERSELKHCLYYPFSPSIDRIDSKIGYTKDNTRLVLTGINLAINQWGIETFDYIAKQYLLTGAKKIERAFDLATSLI